ncbi:unnamed protein product [Parascedosporium putredinis]|uniref:Calcofluor white hypersensitive protein n=1 Tax=Parascedosporium putredinis TaxID=1442378 RepID=A0A9P1H587_9PEZI|nr:unnamed protein product [Parascedosporium putredinis]CAI7996221.1 unnamed protein product [Parascedosporium putredinis]
MAGYKDKDGGVVLSFNGSWVAWSHTAVAYTAFLSALVIGSMLHYHKIVKNEWFGYPDEWFPSVSATIGDRYPERSLFQLFIAITSGPRFALVGLWYILTRKPGHALPKFVGAMGLFRTFTCGGWTYITSTDDHDWHDIFMIAYLVATLPWTLGCIALSPPNPKAIKYRKYIASAFFGTLVPMVYFFLQHKIHRVPGAYTVYAFFEWSLILFDVAFDAVTALDFSTFEVVVKDVKGATSGKELPLGNVLSLRFTWAEAFDTAAEVYHGYVFWSIVTSLGVTVWYFPLWHMGISGYEALIMTTTAPLLLAIKPLRPALLHNQRALHLASLAGIAAYLVETPEIRLFTVGFGVSMSCLSWATTLYAESIHEGRLESKILGLIVGLILSSTMKFAWWTNNPIWPIMHAANGGWNGTGLVLGILAALRFTRKAPLTSGEAPGYPIRGPYSATHGWCTVAAMSAGLLVGLYRPGLVTSWTAYAAGCAGAAILTLYPNWLGYYGALTTATYLTSVCIPFVTNAARQNPVVTFGVGFLIYNFVVLFHVWVVAYAFVPGGPLVRERTDWVMLTLMGLIGCGVYDINEQQGSSRRPARRQSSSQYKKYHAAAAGLVNILFLCATVRRVPSNDYTPYHPEERLITAGIWTIHFSLDNDMWSSEYRMRDLIKELEVDVVGLLESDLQRIIMGNRDTTQFLAEDLGMYVDYGPGPNKHTWGAALLSKFPILNSTHHLLPSPVGELAPAIHATLDVYGRLVDVFVFHSGQEEDVEDRRLQSEYMSKLMGSTDRPAFLLSYLVTKPLKGNYNKYVSAESGMHDVDPTDWDRWCEYILFKGLQRVGYARVSRSTITDTELQLAKFVVPETKQASDELEALDIKTRNQRVAEEEVPKGWRFPSMFRGDGVRGHQYHVFKEPRYFKP